METVGIIAGTGFYSLPALAGAAIRKVETVYGDALLTSGNWNGVPIEFVTRHGVDHSLPPSKVNYRANITALKNLGVNKVIAINVVGGIDPTLDAGQLSLIDDFIDFTSGRESTFFDGIQPGGVQHTDVVDAYDTKIREALSASAKKAGIALRERGVYAGFNGPRFETPAEIRLASLAGATVVGMTGCPEVTLAKEAGLRYASIALVVNSAAGVSNAPITMEEINACLKVTTAKVISIIDGAIANV
ncbi:MAG: S-methyl-5'-thioinosine phosphorylase [Candidatus Nanopelagicaceae bacterium]|nr:S-methyl-5'-thioinosine phosphorylase [Candidatus Nanopelagicaceae bacterium]